MNTANIRSHEHRALGWYAIHWTQTMDWVKSVGKRHEEKPDSEAKKLKEAVKDTHRILAESKSVWPFKLFPDTITVDRQKLTIVYKKFFNSHQSVGVPLENVKNIQADIGPMLGSLTITSDLFINNTQTVTGLPRKDARNIQQLVQGITAALSEGIDLGKIEDTEQLKQLLCRLGEGHVDV